MRIILVLFFFSSIPYLTLADFSDFCTLDKNGTLVRKVIRNTPNPNLVYLKNYNFGDTLNVFIKTDYGGEHNAFVVLTNLETNKNDTLDKCRFIFNPNFNFNQEYKLTINYVNDDLLVESKWEVFHFILNPKIEQQFQSIKRFKQLLLDIETKKEKINNSLIQDSTLISLKINYKPKKQLIRTIQNPVFVEKNKLWFYLKLTHNEKLFLNKLQFNNYLTFDEYKQEYLESVHFNIHYDKNNLDYFDIEFGTYNNSMLIKFNYLNGDFKIHQVNYKISKH